MNEIVAVEQRQLSLGLPGTWEPTGWIAPSTLSFEDWEAIGPMLHAMEGAVHWWIGDWLNHGERKWGEKYAQAMDETEFKYGTLRDDAWVAGRVKLSDRSDNLSWYHHRIVAQFEDSEEQKYWLHQAEENGWGRSELRRQIKQRKLALAPTLPDDKYRVIYADPPWEYGNTMPDYFTEQGNYYSLMTADEIAALPVGKLAEPDAVLFLWVTSPILEEAFDVIEAWGFEYKTSFVWDKVRHCMGHYNSVRHELLLVCTRGSCQPDERKLFDSVVTKERGNVHSEKPEAFRGIIDTLYVYGKKIELFARQSVEGWDTWGDEIP